MTLTMNNYYIFFSSLEKIIIQGYKALQLMYFFTAGPDEVKAWTIQVNLNSNILCKFIYCKKYVSYIETY